MIINLIKNSIKPLFPNIVCILFFTFIYHFCAEKWGDKEDKEKFKSLYDSLYFTITTHFTVGFGDITPKSHVLKSLTMVHLLIAFSLMIV